MTKLKKSVLVLGATGMLGSACFKYLKETDLFHVKGTSRSRYGDLLPLECAEDLDLLLKSQHFDYIVNCIGIIKPQIDEADVRSIESAIRINAVFPYQLNFLSEKYSFKIIQIATDCVFLGDKGNYTEFSAHDAIDIYGKTKSLGEVKSDFVLNLRCSIIGREFLNSRSLIEWVLSQPLSAKINGFRNHLWNGITTFHFAKIVAGLINNDAFFSGIQNIVPQNFLDKYQLLKLISVTFDRPDIVVLPFDSNNLINRTLNTDFAERNSLVWSAAGYSDIPAIEEMVRESKEFYTSFRN